MAVEQCPVTGERCDGKGCEPVALRCETEADRILNLDPNAYAAETIKVAAQLEIEHELYAQFVYDRAFGPGSSMTLGTEGNDNPFA